jgi:GT2 family glycosyltransferase
VSPPSVAIVVLGYNSRAHLPGCLASAVSQSVPARVIFVDNGSADDSIGYVRAAWPQVEVMAWPRNLGFAAGYNRALAAVAEVEWVVMLNPDAELASDWLAVLLAFANEHPSAAVLGGALLFLQAGERTATVQSLGARWTDAGTAFELGYGQPDDGERRPRQTASIPGAALLIRRRTFWDLGGFDPAYFAYLEDVDLCWRAWLNGGEVWAVPAARAWHAVGGSAGGRESPFRIRYMQRNRYINMLKHLEPTTLARGALTSLVYDVYRLGEYALRGQWRGLAALVRGSLDAALGLGPALSARRVWQRRRRRPDAPGAVGLQPRSLS